MPILRAHTGADKIIQTDAKVLLVSNNGMDLLDAVAPSSAILALIVKSIKVHAGLKHGKGGECARACSSSGVLLGLMTHYLLA